MCIIIIIGTISLVVVLLTSLKIAQYIYGDMSFVCPFMSTDFQKKDCYHKIAVASNNAKRCFTNESELDYFKMECVNEVAIKNKNFKACEEINYENLKELHNREMYGDFSPKEEQIKTAKSWQERCISEVAVRYKDPSLCATISNAYLNGNCLIDAK